VHGHPPWRRMAASMKGMMTEFAFSEIPKPEKRARDPYMQNKVPRVSMLVEAGIPPLRLRSGSGFQRDYFAGSDRFSNSSR